MLERYYFWVLKIEASLSVEIEQKYLKITDPFNIIKALVSKADWKLNLTKPDIQ